MIQVARLLSVTCAVAWLAQTPSSVPVTISPPASMDVVLYGGGNDGKILTTTDVNGKGSFDIGSLANLGKVTVVEEKCQDRSRILLMAAGSEPAAQKDCRRRRVGGFVFGKDKALSVHLSGMSTTTKYGLIGGGAAAAAVVAATASGGGGGSTTPTTPTNPGGGGIDLTPLYGTFNVTASKSTDTGCNFSQTFTGQVQISSPNKDGSAVTLKMIERLIRAYSGSVAQNGTYTGTGTGNLDGFIYNGTIGGQISSNGLTISGTETLNFSAGCPGRTVIYQFSGSK